MNIRWLGHSCFLITSESGRTLLTDPYNPDAYPGTLLYSPLDESPDVVTVSHQHADHNNVEVLAGTPVIVQTNPTHEVDGFNIRGISTYHDEQDGSLRGDNTIFRIVVDGIAVCHLGDLGQQLSQARVEQIGDVDVLLIPVGGTFTIDAAGATRVWQQLDPPLTIPMHFRNERCLFDIDGVDRFLAGKPDVEVAGGSDIGVTKENLPASPKIVVLDPYN